MKPQHNGTSAAVLISGGGSNLQALIDACQAGTLDLRISVVLSNNPRAGGLERARRAGIPTEVVEHARWPQRADFDRAVAASLDRYSPDFLLLAGFMRILGEEFVQRYEGRILNIHPSLLPAYPGLNTHQRALDADETWHGATVHFVTADLDAGPPIIQGRVPVLKGDNADTLAARVLTIEHRIYPQAAGLLSSGRVRYDDGQVCLDGEPLSEPLLLANDDGLT